MHILCATISCLLAVPAAEPPVHRWVYLMENLQVNENVPKVQALLKRAAKAGYNGVVVADFKLGVLGRVPDWYFANAEKVRQTAAEVGIELIPAIAPFGYSSAILVHDPNLAAGLPVRGQRFVVTGDKAILESAAKPLQLVPADRSKIPRARAAGWSFQDEPAG